MAKAYCEYCGREFNDVRSLTSSKCPNHPSGFCKGPHKLYEGSIKSSYPDHLQYSVFELS